VIAPTRNAHRAQRELIVAQPLFAGLPLALVNDLVEGSRVLELPAQELLYCAEEPIREAFVLVSGSAMRTHLLPSGNEKVLELAQAPQVLGLGELLGVSHYGASCRIMTPSVVVAIDILCWHEAVQRNRELSWRIIQALAQRQYAIEFDVTGHHSRNEAPGQQSAQGVQRDVDQAEGRYCQAGHKRVGGKARHGDWSTQKAGAVAENRVRPGHITRDEPLDWRQILKVVKLEVAWHTRQECECGNDD